MKNQKEHHLFFAFKKLRENPPRNCDSLLFIQIASFQLGEVGRGGLITEQFCYLLLNPAGNCLSKSLQSLRKQWRRRGRGVGGWGLRVCYFSSRTSATTGDTGERLERSCYICFEIHSFHHRHTSKKTSDFQTLFFSNLKISSLDFTLNWQPCLLCL